MEDVKAFLSDGCGYGDGDGCDDGCCCGCGDGDGDGSGCGCGEGAGRGGGSGYGGGGGCGDGYGDGYGIKSINGKTGHTVDGVQTVIDRLHGNVARGEILGGNLKLTPCYIVKSGNLFAHGETLKAARDALKEKMFENMSEDERIDAFLTEIKAEKRYPTEVFYDWHHKLTGSCDMGRAQFARDHGVDLNGTMTLSEFVELTKDAYGGEVIRNVEKKINLEWDANYGNKRSD